jgi:hypothetical protein
VEKQQTPIFGLARSALEPTIYRTRGEHANHYTTDAIALQHTTNIVFILAMLYNPVVVLSVLRHTDSDYPFGIFKLF